MPKRLEPGDEARDQLVLTMRPCFVTHAHRLKAWLPGAELSQVSDFTRRLIHWRTHSLSSDTSLKLAETRSSGLHEGKESLARPPTLPASRPPGAERLSSTPPEGKVATLIGTPRYINQVPHRQLRAFFMGLWPSVYLLCQSVSSSLAHILIGFFVLSLLSIAISQWRNYTLWRLTLFSRDRS